MSCHLYLSRGTRAHISFSVMGIAVTVFNDFFPFKKCIVWWYNHITPGPNKNKPFQGTLFGCRNLPQNYWPIARIQMYVSTNICEFFLFYARLGILMVMFVLHAILRKSVVIRQSEKVCWKILSTDLSVLMNTYYIFD